MKRIVMIVASILLIGVGVFAADGDLIVNGNFGAGTSTPRSKADVAGTLTASEIVEERGLSDLAKGITPAITAGSLSGGGPTYVGPASYWTTTTAGSSMTIDTGITTTNSSIVGVSFGTFWRRTGNSMPRDYVISGSADNIVYTTLTSTSGNSSLAVTHYFTAMNARYIRLTVTGFATGGVARISRFQILSIYGAASYGRGPWAVNTSGNIFPAVTGSVGIGTSNPKHGAVSIYSGAVPIVLSETDQTGATGYWRLPADSGGLRIDQNTSTLRDFTTFRTPFSIDLSGNVRLGGSASEAGGTETIFVGVNNGNVGIGTTGPLYKLDVAGVIRATNVAPPSDRRFKDNLKSIESPLNKVLSMEGVTFNWKRDEFKAQNFPEGTHYGVIAQEMEKVLPEVVLTASDGSKSVAYMEIIPVLIEAIKEQQKEIEQLKKIIAGN